MEDAPGVPQWPAVLTPRKRQAELATVPEGEDPAADFTIPNFQGRKGRTMRKLMQTYLRMQDVGRIINMGMSDPPGDGRGWAAVALIKLGRYVEAGRLAAGPDGQTPCGYLTLRYVSNQLAKAGALEGALHLARLQGKCGRTRYVPANARIMQSVVEVGALYLQATSENMSRLLAAHGAQVAMEVEKLLQYKGDVLAMTPNRRYLLLTEAFNQLIRWYGRARLVPQAMRACEIMNELGIPRDEMTLHFLSRGAAQQTARIKKAKTIHAVPPDWPGKRPEVVFIGRTNSGKSAMINALFSSLVKVAPSSKTRAWTRTLDFYEINRERAGLPHFQIVDTPGLGYAGIPNAAAITRTWPDLIYNYLRRREALKHVFHFVDARNTKLLPADKQLLHLLAKAQRRDVRYTIVITKIDVVKRNLANSTAHRIKEELAPYCDVDIMFASARSLRGVDHLWSKIWQTVTETPRGQRHRELGARELARLRAKNRLPDEVDELSEMLGIPRAEKPRSNAPAGFEEEWEEDEGVEPEVPDELRAKGGKQRYFVDHWDQDELADDEDFDEEEAIASDESAPASRSQDPPAERSFEEGDEDDDEDDDMDDADFERNWNAAKA